MGVIPDLISELAWQHKLRARCRDDLEASWELCQALVDNLLAPVQPAPARSLQPSEPPRLQPRNWKAAVKLGSGGGEGEYESKSAGEE